MKMSRHPVRTAVLFTSAIALVAGGCAAGGDDSGGSSTKPIKVGLITDVTGPASQGQENAPMAAQARIDALNADGGIDGRKVELVVGDTASSPTGALTAAKKLIQQDKVEAVLSWTYLYFGAADFVAAQKIPVFGGSWDASPGWGEHKNMFGSQPVSGADVIVSTTYPTIMQDRDVSKVAVVGLNTESAKHATDGVAESAKAAGLSVAYKNQSVQPTDIDFTSVAIAIKKSGADGVYASLPSTQVYALSSALRQQGVDLKLYLGATGYGQALIDNKTALAGSEGAVFVSWYAPKELETEATKTMAANLQKYGDYAGSFDFSAAGPYLNAEAFIASAEAAEGDIDAASITKGAQSLTDFDFAGLLAHPADWSKPDAVNGPGLGYGNCTFLITVKDGAFVPLDDKPVCGTAKNVS